MAEKTIGELDKNDLKNCRAKIAAAKSEMQKIVIGQDETVDALFRAMLADGHVLIEGVPGIAKTLIMVALSQTTGTDFKRIQFTPDMLPSDIVGISTYDPKKGFTTIKGPVFTNLVLADEINRASPKVQSAMLEAMQERQVTIAGETFGIQHPFLVLATQNTMESLGVYTLPAAQLDRFLFKLNMGYLTPEQEKTVLKKNTTIYKLEDFGVAKVLKKEDILEYQKLTHKIYLGDEVEEYIINLVNATRYPQKYGIELGKYVQYGASPRASIGLYIAAKAQALIKGQTFVTSEHVKEVAHDVLRHRVFLNYEGQAEEIDEDKIIAEILAKVPVE
ncbi:ATPase [Candidatus Micrarchaeota archaeon CG1_02_60_51]|nr:MAG: ATPase [Candidatus Micrarchaeota archaeon CG1_02_60_51]